MKTVKWPDIAIAVGAACGLDAWVRGEDQRMAVGGLAFALVVWLVRVLVQRHQYLRMTPTEQELYREQVTWLQYHPRLSDEDAVPER